MISVVIPTFRRERVLLQTIGHLSSVSPPPLEIIVVDQTEHHEADIERTLTDWSLSGKIRWLLLKIPSIPHAMNVGLQEALGDVVLFVDDDIVPSQDLIEAHSAAHEVGHRVVAGQVLQPGEEPRASTEGSEFSFRCDQSGYVSEFMAGNFSIRRDVALKLRGFDENFVKVAYRFEAEFAERLIREGEKIFYEPRASIRHLKEPSGGTRTYGNHLKAIGPSHSVGAYYFLLRSGMQKHRLLRILQRPFREVKTRFHLRHPWWILPKMLSELLALVWAGVLAARGPKLIGAQDARARS